MPHQADNSPFECLKNERRRALVTILATYPPGSRVEAGDLARQTYGYMNDKHPGSLRGYQYKSERTSISKYDLPRLEEAGFVELDDRLTRLQVVTTERTLDLAHFAWRGMRL